MQIVKPMKLESLMAPYRSVIVQKWFNAVVETYPPDTAVFLKRQKDPFANPVGRATRAGLEALFDQLAGAMDRAALAAAVDPIIRIRAVQNFSPSRAVDFVFTLKEIVRDTVPPGSSAGGPPREWLVLDGRIDTLALVAFDIYAACREKLLEIRCAELTRNLKAYQRAGMSGGSPQKEPPESVESD